MSDLDLTEALDAAARAQYERQYPNTALPWDVMPAMNRHVAREMFLPPIAAAAPIIEAQVREQVAQAIEAEAHRHRCVVGESPFEGGTWSAGNDRGIGYGLDLAARIARGQR